MTPALIARSLGRLLGSLLPLSSLAGLVRGVAERAPEAVLEGFGPLLNRERTLANMPFDLAAGRPLQFENLAGLFASTSLDHAVVAMPIRQAAYLFGIVRQMPARKVIEIGRYKGGSTLVIAAALSGQERSEFWSVDSGEKETRLTSAGGHESYDQQLGALCARHGLRVELVVGDSRTVELDTGEVDVVLIDGDHSYDGVKSDFERFGRRVRPGGAVLLDDAFDEDLFRTHSDTVGRLVKEVTAAGGFRLVAVVNRMAHLERVG